MTTDHFKETELLELYPGDTEVAIKEEVTIKTADSATDGFLAYGRSVSSVVATIFDDDTGTDVTTEMLSTAATESDNIITIVLDYPLTSGAGTYMVKTIITLDDGSTREVRLRKIKAVT